MSENYTTHDYAKLFATQTNQNIFLTGKAGTGKTTFLHRLRETTDKQMAVVAPTGVAAINAGGTTIHSFFQLPITPFFPTELGRKELISKQKMQSNKRRVLRELELLVIDEISMVRADVLDAIDTVLRHVRYRFTEPFGGVQMIVIGDMYQLSPVVQNEEWQILSQFYRGVYFFNSVVFQEKPFVHIEFEKIFRQKDIGFIRLLNEVRNNRLSLEGQKLLDSRYAPSFVPPTDDTYIVLTTHNYKSDRINSEELRKISSNSTTFQAEIRGEFPEKSFPAEEKLELKVGAKVMFIKNDTEFPRRFFNGKIGVITAWGKGIIHVKCPEDEDTIAVIPMEWENVRYQADKTTLQVSEELLGSFKQFPLRLAWAITIHKSQGLTFDKAVIDAEAAFTAGQVYVALSRCRSLEGLVLLSKIDLASIRNDSEVLQFSSGNFSMEQLESSYQSSRIDYYLSLLIQIFDFKQMATTVSRWLMTTHDSVPAFGDETTGFLRSLKEQVDLLREVGQQFGIQITQLVQAIPFNEEALNLRLEASETYFSKKLNELTEILKQSPAVTDSREKAKVYDEALMDVFTEVEKKKYWIKGVRNGFSVEKYFGLRKSFELPEIKISAYSRNQTKKKIRSKHPELMGMLFELRNFIVDETGMPIYLVANSKTIVEMADYLPQTKSDLLKINGFGEVKYEKFGEQFLEVIRDYCEENGLEPDMPVLFEKEKKTKKEKKPKVKKGDSALISLEQYHAGRTITEIAGERNLTHGTIAGHLNQFVEKGELNITNFVSAEKLEKARSLVENSDYDGSVFGLLNEYFEQQEIPFIVGWLRRKNP